MLCNYNSLRDIDFDFNFNVNPVVINGERYTKFSRSVLVSFAEMYL